jgi:hypothetical protein
MDIRIADIFLRGGFSCRQGGMLKTLSSGDDGSQTRA